MAADVAAARALVELGAAEEALLRVAGAADRARAAARRRARVGRGGGPGARELGVMLPYSPLHHLLLADAGAPLVLTSGNVCDEPIAYRDDDARGAAGADRRRVPRPRPPDPHAHRRLGRARRARARGRAAPLARRRCPARSRCRSPAPRPVLACGAELKSTFCLAKGGARLGRPPHRRPAQRGDARAPSARASRTSSGSSPSRPRSSRTTCTPTTSRPPTRSSARASSSSACSTTTRTSPRAWPSTARPAPAVGAIYDGAGLGTDGTVWGGEMLVGDLRGFERAGHLRPVRLPGGDRAAREPWRMACAWLVAAGARGRRPGGAARGGRPRTRWDAVAQMAARGLRRAA